MADHQRRWGAPAVVSRAPGRVNLIGEHTDYNDGFVLPMALPFDTAVAASLAPAPPSASLTASLPAPPPASPTASLPPAAPASAASPPPENATMQFHSEGFGSVEFELADQIDATLWSAHLRGLCQLLSEEGVNPGPWRATIVSDIPAGASLSSSAALEVAIALAALGLAGGKWDAKRIAKLGQRVENEIVGVQSGIMDQLISASAQEGHASLIDCRSLQATNIAFPEGVVVAVLDTSTRRQLVGSAYDDRRKSCERAAAALGLDSLRDAQLSDLQSLPSDLEVERRRARHVITENQRTLDAAQALANGNTKAFGDLMNESHFSLCEDYEVSGPALDQIATIAREQPGCFGARMTGGGFAGCAVALVSAECASEFSSAVIKRFRDVSGFKATIWLCNPSSGGSCSPSPGGSSSRTLNSLHSPPPGGSQ